MQRVDMHFRGLEVPALGSPRDVIFRAYLTREARAKAKEQEMMYLVALASAGPGIDLDKWGRLAGKTFNDYVSLLYGKDPAELTNEDKVLMEFYEKVVKPSKVVITKDKKGNLLASGIPIPIPEKSKKKKA